jgi:hypothetical protein
MRNPFEVATPIAKKLKILLYGESGTGKTLAALSFPRVALVDAEGGSDLYRGRPGIPPFHVVATKSVSELEAAIAFIEQDKGKTFDTLVIDPISVFYDVLKEATAKATKTGDMGFREWAKVNTRMGSIYNRLTNLNAHVIVISRQSTEYESSGNELRRVGVKPDADKKITYPFDFIVQLTPEHGGVVRKSRGMALGEGQRLAAVNWQVFEPIAQAFVQGATIQQQDETDMSDDEAQRLRLKAEFEDTDTVKAFVAKWREMGLSNSDLLTALGLHKRFGEWVYGQAAANQCVNDWIAARMAQTDGDVADDFSQDSADDFAGAPEGEIHF